MSIRSVEKRRESIKILLAVLLYIILHLHAQINYYIMMLFKVVYLYNLVHHISSFCTNYVTSQFLITRKKVSQFLWNVFSCLAESSLPQQYIGCFSFLGSSHSYWNQEASSDIDSSFFTYLTSAGFKRSTGQ